MQKSPILSITKSDFMLFREAPLHLWAEYNGKYLREISKFDQHLIDQGYKVESLAREYLENVIQAMEQNQTILWQQTYQDGPFEVRTDALIHKPNINSYDLYEIKSKTSPDKDDIYDVTFQVVALSRQITLGRIYILHINKEYQYTGGIDLSSFFIAEDVTDKVDELKTEVENLRQEALRVIQSTDSTAFERCWKPRECPCPELCHPNLPEFSIYDIPGIRENKKRELVSRGIVNAKDIPDSFALNDKQKLVVKIASTNLEHIDYASIRAEMEQIVFPVYFLDYETCMCAIPQYEGYHPQQQIVFQYSLHKVENPESEAIHSEHISINATDPALSLLAQLIIDIGDSGTVIVWNKTFEMTRNKEMATLHPKYSTFLDALNQRIYDLGELVNQGYYLHPGFKGSWSIKKVLPVMVSELSYKDMEINEGGAASSAWWNICFGSLTDKEKDHLIEALLRYCELDTWAMVKIFDVFWNQLLV